MTLGSRAWYGCKLKSKLYKQQHNGPIHGALISSQPSGATAHKHNLPFFPLLPNSQTGQHKDAKNKEALIDGALERGEGGKFISCVQIKRQMRCVRPAEDGPLWKCQVLFRMTTKWFHPQTQTAQCPRTDFQSADERAQRGSTGPAGLQCRGTVRQRGCRPAVLQMTVTQCTTKPCYVGQLW